MTRPHYILMQSDLIDIPQYIDRVPTWLLAVLVSAYVLKMIVWPFFEKSQEVTRDDFNECKRRLEAALQDLEKLQENEKKIFGQLEKLRGYLSAMQGNDFDDG